MPTPLVTRSATPEYPRSTRTNATSRTASHASQSPPAIAGDLNGVIELYRGLARELKRFRSAAGKEVKLGQRASPQAGRAGQSSCVECVNELMASAVERHGAVVS
jgi:hypothetical protein